MLSTGQDSQDSQDIHVAFAIYTDVCEQGAENSECRAWLDRVAIRVRNGLSLTDEEASHLATLCAKGAALQILDHDRVMETGFDFALDFLGGKNEARTGELRFIDPVQAFPNATNAARALGQDKGDFLQLLDYEQRSFLNPIPDLDLARIDDSLARLDDLANQLRSRALTATEGCSAWYQADPAEPIAALAFRWRELIEELKPFQESEYTVSSILLDDDVALSMEEYSHHWTDIGFIRSSTDREQNIYGDTLEDLWSLLRTSPEVTRCLGAVPSFS